MENIRCVFHAAYYSCDENAWNKHIKMKANLKRVMCMNELLMLVLEFCRYATVTRDVFFLRSEASRAQNPYATKSQCSL